MITFSEFANAKATIEQYVKEQGSNFQIGDIVLPSGRILDNLTFEYNSQNGVETREISSFYTYEQGLQ